MQLEEDEAKDNDLSFQKSTSLYYEALKVIPGGLNSRTRLGGIPGRHPLYIERAYDSKLVDVDGNEYIDFLMGYGPIILGYCNPIVNRAVEEQLHRGTLFGMSSELEIDVAKKILTSVPHAEQVFMSNTGTEANQMATRLSRAYTGKPKIAKFEGHYHGWLDWCFVDSVYNMVAFMPSPRGGGLVSPVTSVGEAGIPPRTAEDYVVLPWNEPEAVEKVLKRKSDEIAAVIMEPSGPAGALMPEAGFLELIRDMCSENGILLIFDEVKTGFRLSLGGYQERYQVFPDLSTFAKSVGNGFPTAAVAGKREVMDLINTGVVSHAGTFNGNPLSMAACSATLEQLAQPNKYEYLYRLTTKLVSGMTDAIRDTQAEAILVGPATHKTKPGPIIDIYFTSLETIRSFRDLRASGREIDARRQGAFIHAMLKRGVHIISHVWFISFSHTEEQVEYAVRAVEESLKEAMTTA